MTTIDKHFLGLFLSAVLILSFLAGCGGGGGGNHGPAPATLASIEVTPTNPSIAVGTTQQFKATGIYSDKTKKDLTSSVIWSSTDTAKATVSDAAGSKGLATAVSTGSTTIKATSGSISGSTTLTVKAESVILAAIEVTPSNPSIAVGTKQQFTATGIFSDNSKQDLTTQVTWGSDTTIATINSTGLATSVAEGVTTITAAFLGKTGNAKLTVKAASITLDSIEVTPTNHSIALGTTQQFTATGIFSDGSKQELTTQVTWSSSNTGSATIDNTGLAASVASGSTSISAALGGKSGSTTLTVTSASLVSIGIFPTNPSIALGTGQPFTATGIFSDGTNVTSQDLTTMVTWGSETPGVATISNAPGSEGLATSVLTGSTTITAAFRGKYGSTLLTITPATLDSIEVIPTKPSIALGTTKQFTATGIYSDNTKQDLTTQVTWHSSNPEFATIDNTGLATSVAQGSTTITATFESVPISTTLTVTPAALVSIGITPASQSIAKGLTLPFTATGVYSDNTKQNLTTEVTWSSSDGGVSAISNASYSEGVATAVGVGSATISASFEGKTGEATLTVTAATLNSIEVTSLSLSIAKGLSLPFYATGIFSDGSTQDLTTQVAWSSSAETVAIISNADGSEGLATAIGVGSTRITASFEGKTGETMLVVTAATLSSIEVAAPSLSVAKGLSLPFYATGIFSDGSTQDLTALVTWSSSDDTVATISNAVRTEGLATAIAKGSTTITATSSLGGTPGSATLTVTDATLSFITVTSTPPTPSIAKGLSLQFTATGTFSDGSTQDLTSQVTWSSSNEIIATISNSAGTEGLATAINLGQITITAASSLGGTPGSATLKVTDAILNTIEVAPAAQQMALGTKLQYTATGIFSDTTQVDLTKQVTWSSLNTGVAVISNGTQTKGLATAIGVGSTTITATFGGKSGNTALTVITTAFSSIDVIPATATIKVGDKLQFKALGHFQGGSTTQDLTLSVTWSSTNKNVATVSNARKTRGLATGVSASPIPPTTTIKATEGGVVGSATLTVTPYQPS